jgi:dipeptide/tripeptide permease
MMFSKNIMVSLLALLLINGLSYFVTLPFAHSQAKAHYYNLELSILYAILAIAVPLMLFKFYKSSKHILLKIVVLTISLSFIFWAIYLNSIECSTCSKCG